jgi:succinate-semialdehyde dehydrogenase / glutarate-semialdehyde dehydrogenase
MTLFKVIDPATGELVDEVPATPDRQVDRALARAEEASRAWRRMDHGERGEILWSAAEILRAEAQEYAQLMAREMGKPLEQGRSEAEKCAWVCEYYAEKGPDFLAPQVVETDASRSYVSFQPLGTVLSIMPWNFPFWQVLRFSAPALMAGNAVILKHASNVPGCARQIQALYARAGLPEGLFHPLFLDNDRTGALIEDPRIHAVTLTGSTRAGKAVAARAGSVLKKTVLELGGSDPYIVLGDADVERAAEICVRSRLINSGQSCIAAKRFIVVRELRDRFESAVVEGMAAAVHGPPSREGVQVGPLARKDLRDTLHGQVEASIGKGARLLLGGELPDGPGWFYPSTVLTAVAPGMPAYEEELFGPVASIIPVDDEVEALQVANDSRYGLGGAVFTADVARGEELATRELDVGCAFVNDLVRSDPRLPFGGVKESGIGRELSGFGIREFVNVKTVWVA